MFIFSTKQKYNHHQKNTHITNIFLFNLSGYDLLIFLLVV